MTKNTFVLIAAFASILSGCGQTLEMVEFRDGIPRRQVVGEVGWSNVALDDRKDDGLMRTCMAHISAMKKPLVDEEGVVSAHPEYNPLEVCTREVLTRQLRRTDRQRDIAAEPWRAYPWMNPYYPWVQPSDNNSNQESGQ